MLRDDINWRVKHRGSNVAYFQPACLTRLDTAIAQYSLPSPHHLRLSAPAFAAQVLAGAPETLRGRSLKSVCVRVALADASSTVALMTAGGWREESRDEGPADVQLVFVR
jgi:hypothetical protein